MIIYIIHNIIIYVIPLHRHYVCYSNFALSPYGQKKTNARVLGTNTLAVPPHTYIILYIVLYDLGTFMICEYVYIRIYTNIMYDIILIMYQTLCHDALRLGDRVRNNI